MKNKILKLMASNSLEIKSVFVPLSESRNAGEKLPTLNYKVSLIKNGKTILTTDYSMGYAHTPGHKNPQKDCGSRSYHMQHIAEECQKGYALFRAPSGSFMPKGGVNHKKWILPDTVDVIYSLLQNGDVLDYSGFESWASDFGYDPDSRKGEKIYKDCLAIALKLNSAIPCELREKFNELFQDYFRTIDHEQP